MTRNKAERKKNLIRIGALVVAGVMTLFRSSRGKAMN